MTNTHAHQYIVTYTTPYRPVTFTDDGSIPFTYSRGPLTHAEAECFAEWVTANGAILVTITPVNPTTEADLIGGAL